MIRHEPLPYHWAKPLAAGVIAGNGARLPMDTTLNYAIGSVIIAGAVALALAILVW